MSRFVKRFVGFGVLFGVLIAMLALPAMASAGGSSAVSTYMDPAKYQWVSPTVPVKVQGLPSSNGVQVKINHGSNVRVVAPQCSGLFAGAFSLGPVSVPGGTLIGCYYMTPGQYTQGTGEVMRFTLQNVFALFTISDSLRLGTEPGFGTMFSKDGDEVGANASSSALNVVMMGKRVYFY